MSQPQTHDVPAGGLTPEPIVGANAKWVNGAAPGYWPTADSGLTLNLSAGTSFARNIRASYAGGTLSLTDNSTNYVFLDTTASNAPSFNTSGYPTTGIPIATVVTASGAITTITDDRTWFAGGFATATLAGLVPTPPNDARYYLDGTANWSVPPGSGGGPSAIVRVVEIAVTSSAPGNFTVAHGQPSAPLIAFIEATTDGGIWFQTSRYDGTNVYLAASDAAVSARVSLWFIAADAELTFTSSVGNFSVAHGLGVVPALALVQMTSDGNVWFQTAIADATNVFAAASSASLTGYIEVWKNVPLLTVLKQAVVALTPSTAGVYTIAHGLGTVPRTVIIRMTSDGSIYEAAGADATNLNLTASDGGITGQAEVWA